MSMLKLMLRAQQRDVMCATDYIVLRKVRNGVELVADDADSPETEAWFWLVRMEYIDYQTGQNAWLTEKGERALANVD